MKIAVINGSPKGKYSITLQTVLYLERKYPEHQFCVLNAGQKIKALEKDFSEAKALIEGSDAVLFSYPVYTFLAPSQLHRFIELMKQNNVETKDKFATQISTSKHFSRVIGTPFCSTPVQLHAPTNLLAAANDSEEAVVSVVVCVASVDSAVVAVVVVVVVVCMVVWTDDVVVSTR